MDFESAAKAAERLGVTVRAVQKWAKEGKLQGAKQLGRAWMIPVDATPTDPAAAKSADSVAARYTHTPFPLLNSSFAAGHAAEAVLAIADEDERAVATAELDYYCGRVESAARITEAYLDHEDPALALSAAFLYAFSNLSLGKINLALLGLRHIEKNVKLARAVEHDPRMYANAVLFATAAYVLLHMPIPRLPSLQSVLSRLTRGQKMFACYIIAYDAYLHKEYDRSRGIAEIALASGGDEFPIASQYLRMIICIDLMSLRKAEEARECFEKLWEMSHADGGYEVIGEQHGLLHGLPEICLKRKYPDQFKQIVAVAQRFGAAWRTLHFRSTGNQIASGLTTTEFAIAMLYTKGWAVKEIALHMEMSERMIKYHITMVYEKLGVSNREELSRYMMK